jgi:predicted ATP-dependent endonuclease of OLD family
MEINSSENQFARAPIQLPDDKHFFVIVGGNNSGKSTFLREVAKTFQRQSYRIDVNRTILRGEGAQQQNYEQNRVNWNNTLLSAQDDNFQKDTQTLQDFFLLNDDQRKPIIQWYNDYFPTRLYEEREKVDNDASPKLLKANGYSITKQGSGMRSTIEIFIRLFDPTVKVLCIDEPELGLEPILQKFLFQAIKDKASDDKKIFIATHSHHFLDLEDQTNNYVCTRNENNLITLEQVTDLQNVIFRLLGNTLSSYLLPDNVIILEGPSDTTFLKRALELLNKTSYKIQNSRGIGNVSYAFQAITQFLRFNQNLNPVYIERVYVLVDRVHRNQDTLLREWRRIVPNPERQVCVLDQNGIEYYYPERILQQIFNTTDNRETIIAEYLKENPNKYNDITKSKVELSQEVAALVTAEDLANPENQLFRFLTNLPVFV